MLVKYIQWKNCTKNKLFRANEITVGQKPGKNSAGIVTIHWVTMVSWGPSILAHVKVLGE